MTQTVAKKGSRLTGDARDQVLDDIRRRYVDKAQSMRTIAEAIGRSYGFVHRVLTIELQVTVRGRGGAGQSGNTNGQPASSRSGRRRR